MNFNSTENMEIKCIQFELNFLVNKVFLPASLCFDATTSSCMSCPMQLLNSPQFNLLRSLISNWETKRTFGSTTIVNSLKLIYASYAPTTTTTVYSCCWSILRFDCSLWCCCYYHGCCWCCCFVVKRLREQKQETKWSNSFLMITFHLSIFNIKNEKKFKKKPKKQTNIFLMFENYRHQHKLGENEKFKKKIGKNN